MAKPDRQVGPTTLRNVIPYQLIDVEPIRRPVGVAAEGGSDGQ